MTKPKVRITFTYAHNTVRMRAYEDRNDISAWQGMTTPERAEEYRVFLRDYLGWVENPPFSLGGVTIIDSADSAEHLPRIFIEQTA